MFTLEMTMDIVILGYLTQSGNLHNVSNFFKGIGHLIMTCCNHNDGCNKDFLHLSSQPHHN